MSEHDPFAPKSGPTVEEAKSSVPVAEVAPVEVPEAPQTEEQTVPEGSIKEVLGWVGEDSSRAQAALNAENDGEKRKTLVKELTLILDK